MVNTASRFRYISITKVPNSKDLIENAVYIITYGRGQKEKPIAVSIPYIIYEQIPHLSEMLTLMVNYSEMLSVLRRRKYYGVDGREEVINLIEQARISMKALEQVFMDEIGSAISTLEN